MEIGRRWGCIIILTVNEWYKAVLTRMCRLTDTCLRPCYSELLTDTQKMGMLIALNLN